MELHQMALHCGVIGDAVEGVPIGVYLQLEM